MVYHRWILCPRSYLWGDVAIFGFRDIDFRYRRDDLVLVWIFDSPPYHSIFKRTLEEAVIMFITDYSMVNVGTDEEDCEMKNIRFAMKDLQGAIVKKVTKEEITIELTGYRKGDLIHINTADQGFDYSTLEGGKA